MLRSKVLVGIVFWHPRTFHFQCLPLSFSEHERRVTYKREEECRKTQFGVKYTAQSVFQSMERICIEQEHAVQFTLR